QDRGGEPRGEQQPSPGPPWPSQMPRGWRWHDPSWGSLALGALSGPGNLRGFSGVGMTPQIACSPGEAWGCGLGYCWRARGCLADHRQHNQPREEHRHMSIVVTGATGHLGRLVVEALLPRGVAAEQVLAPARRTQALGDLAERGVVVRRADFNDEASLPEAFADADKLLLVSGSEAGQRVHQHGNAINAAKAAGVRFIAYTSGVRANTSTLLVNQDHRATERLLAEALIPHALLRNSWYLENYTGQLPVYLERGIVGAAGAGKVSAAKRAAYAGAAGAVLVGEGHAGAVYELGGEPFTMAELAEV